MPEPIRSRLAFRLCFLILLAAAALCAHAQAPEPLVINGLGRGAAVLDGPWQFHTGDDPAWASPTFDDSGWQQIQVGRPWEGQGHRNYTGYAWYRRHIAVNASSSNLDLGLLFPGVEDACEVYWNGVFIGRIGQLPPHPLLVFSRWPSVIPLGPRHSGVLAIRVWKSPHYFLSDPDEGGLFATPRIGVISALQQLDTAERFRWLQGNQFSLYITVLSTVVAVLALLAWLRNRRRWMLLWLAIAMSHDLAMLPLHIPGLVSFRVGYGYVGVAIMVYQIALWFLLLDLLGLSQDLRLVRFTRWLSVFVFALAPFDTFFEIFDLTWRLPRLFLFIDVATTIPFELCELYGVVLVVLAFRKRLDAARWFLAISLLAAELYQAATDIFGLGVRWTHWTVSDTLSRPLFTIAGNYFTFSTLAGTLLLIAILYSAWRYSTEQSQRQSALEREFQSAQEVQQLLIPAKLPATPGFSVETVYLPASEVGGDFFQILPANDGSLLIVVGDVSGKGLKAAMTVSAIIGALRDQKERRPAQVLAHLNRVLYGNITGFATCTAALIAADGKMALANAGNLAPYRNGEELPVDPGLPLGILAESNYAETSHQLNPDDRLTFVSDGVVEATNEKRELFGFERTQAISSQPASAIAEIARKFGQMDDISVLSVTRTATMKEAIA